MNVYSLTVLLIIIFNFLAYVWLWNKPRKPVTGCDIFGALVEWFAIWVLIVLAVHHG